MKASALRLLQVYLGFIGIYHVVNGIGLNFSRSFMEALAAWYGARVDWTPQFTTILHPIGAFMFILGVLACTAAFDPLRYRAVVYSFAGLFAIRALQRILFKQEIEQAFGIESARNLFNVVLFFGMAGLLFGLYRYVERDAGALAAAK